MYPSTKGICTQKSKLVGPTDWDMCTICSYGGFIPRQAEFAVAAAPANEANGAIAAAATATVTNYRKSAKI